MPSTAMTKLITSFTVFALSAALNPAAAGELTGNMGFMSDYMVGGLYQTSSAAYTGIDYAADGLCAGTRVADLDEGVEFDLYGGYNHSLGNGFTAGVSAAGYFYSDEFDKTYREAGVNLDYKLVRLELIRGNWDGDLDPLTDGAQNADYTFASLKIGQSVYAKVGGYGGDFNGDYFAMGYNKTVGDLNLAVSLVLPDHNLDLHATADAKEAALAEDPTQDVSGVTDRDVYLTFELCYRFAL
jgi:hypothetical protein